MKKARRITIEFIGDVRRLIEKGHELPPTSFRCAVCGRRVGRYDPADDRHVHRDRLDAMTCPKHGVVRDIAYRDWRAEWERRGKPESLNLRLPPVQ